MTASTAYSYEQQVADPADESGAVDRYGFDHHSLAWEAWSSAVGSELNKLIALPHNWDSHGGSPPSLEACSTAGSLLSKLGPEFDLPDFFPLADGGLLLEWETAEHEISCEIRGSSSVSLLVEAAEGSVIAEVAELSLSAVLLEYFGLLVEILPWTPESVR